MAGKTRNSVILSVVLFFNVIAISTNSWTTSEFMFNTWKGAKKISQDDVVSMTVSLHRVKIRTTANKYVLRTYKLNQCEQFNDRGTYSEGDRDRCDRLQTAGNMALIFGTFALCSLFGTVSLIIVNKYYELGIDIEFFEILMTFIACVTLGLSWMSFSFFRPVNLPHAYGAPQSLSFSFWMMFLSFFATLITFLTRFIETAGDDESAYFDFMETSNPAHGAFCLFCCPLYAMTHCLQATTCNEGVCCLCAMPCYSLYKCSRVFMNFSGYNSRQKRRELRTGQGSDFKAAREEIGTEDAYGNGSYGYGSSNYGNDSFKKQVAGSRHLQGRGGSPDNHSIHMHTFNSSSADSANVSGADKRGRQSWGM